VGKVSVLIEDGLELFFNSSDHLPPHFHAERPGEWEVRVFFLREEHQMVELKWGKLKKQSKKQLGTLCANVAAARGVLMKEWEQKVSQFTLGEE
jgi:hypothetical protein